MSTRRRKRRKRIPRPTCKISLLYLLLLLAVNDISGAFTPPAQLRIAHIGPIDPVNVNSVQYGQAGLFACRTYINQINRASAAWRANQSLPMPMLPYTELVLDYYDSKSLPSATVNAAVDAIAAGASIIIGEYQTPTSQIIQYVASNHNVTQISPTANGIEFTTDHAATYPYFARTVPSIGIEAILLTRCLKEFFGWTRFAMLRSSDSFGAGAAATVVQTAKTFGLTVLADVPFNIGDTDFTFSILRLIDSNARIFAFYGAVTELRTCWLQMRSGFQSGAFSTDLLGPGYQWMLNHAVITPTLFSQVTANGSSIPIPQLAEIMPGMLAMQFYINNTTPAFQQYVAAIAAEPYWSVTSLVHRAANILPFPRSWDATSLAVRGLNAMLAQELDPSAAENRPALYQSVLQQSFTGASGPIKLDALGDVNTGLAVYNFRSTVQDWVPIGLFNNASHLILFPFISQDSIEYRSEDPHTKPLDTPPRQLLTISNNVVTALITVCCILLLIIFGVAGALWHFRDQAAVRASSPLFVFLFLLGVQALLSSVIARALEGHSSLQGNADTCNADLWLSNIGYTLLTSALIVKTYRLFAIMHERDFKRRAQYTDAQLLLCILLLLLVESGILLALEFGAPMSLDLIPSGEALEFEYYACWAGPIQDTSQVVSIYLPVTISTRFTLLMITAVTAYRVRNISAIFNESKALLVTTYNLLFLSALLPAIDGAMGRGTNAAVIAYSICVFLICVLSVFILVYPKFVQVYRKLQRDPNLHNSQPSIQTQASSASTYSTPLPVAPHPTKMRTGERAPAYPVSAGFDPTEYGGGAAQRSTDRMERGLATVGEDERDALAGSPSPDPSQWDQTLPTQRSSMDHEGLSLELSIAPPPPARNPRGMRPIEAALTGEGDEEDEDARPKHDAERQQRYQQRMHQGQRQHQQHLPPREHNVHNPRHTVSALTCASSTNLHSSVSHSMPPVHHHQQQHFPQSLESNSCRVAFEDSFPQQQLAHGDIDREFCLPSELRQRHTTVSEKGMESLRVIVHETRWPSSSSGGGCSSSGSASTSASSNSTRGGTKEKDTGSRTAAVLPSPSVHPSPLASFNLSQPSSPTTPGTASPTPHRATFHLDVELAERFQEFMRTTPSTRFATMEKAQPATAVATTTSTTATGVQASPTMTPQ